MMVQGHQRLLLAAALAGILAVSGCLITRKTQQARTAPREFLQKDWPAQEAPVAKLVRRDYRLREGDRLEIIYHVRHQRNVAYRIKIQDVISVRFPFAPEMTQVGQVQSDGTLRLDLVGAIYVFDRTVEDVQAELIEKYGKYIKKPVLTVSFKQSNVRISELKDAIKTSPRGQSRLVPITPDGNISLPFVSNVHAAGSTIGELHGDLNARYKELGLDELEVTVNLQAAAPMRVFILGEVLKPGAIATRSDLAAGFRELTVIQAIAQAGGPRAARAELSKVMLVRRRHLGRPQAAIVNVFQLLVNARENAGGVVVADSAAHRHDIWLEDGDVVYVPTSKMAKRADYIEYAWTKTIRAVLGLTSSVDYSASDTVDWLGPN